MQFQPHARKVSVLGLTVCLALVTALAQPAAEAQLLDKLKKKAAEVVERNVNDAEREVLDATDHVVQGAIDCVAGEADCPATATEQQSAVAANGAPAQQPSAAQTQAAPAVSAATPADPEAQQLPAAQAPPPPAHDAAQPHQTEGVGLIVTLLATWNPGADWKPHESRPVSIRGMTVDRAGRAYLTDFNNNWVRVYDTSGALLAKWESPGGNGQFRQPRHAAMDGEGNVYVVDTYTVGNQWRPRVQVFSGDGTLLRAWDTPFLCEALAVGRDGKAYCAGTVGQGVQVYGSDGSSLAKWSIPAGNGAGQFFALSAMAVDDAGNLHIADSVAHRVSVLSPNGAFLRAWGSQGRSEGQFVGPRGIAIDGHGRIYVADTGNHRVQVFSTSGDFLLAWGERGSGAGQFSAPLHISVSGDGSVYVEASGLVQVFRVDAGATTAVQ